MADEPNTEDTTTDEAAAPPESADAAAGQGKAKDEDGGPTPTMEQ